MILLPTHRLELLSRSDNRLLLSRGLRGVEREALRVDRYGHLATTPHPRCLGAALTHPHITTDYSEALLEIITPPERETAAMLARLDTLHRFAVAGLGTETLWCNSMPCRLPEESKIPVASYGTSHEGMLKHVYRLGLAIRYGKAMQCIAGIHYNFSVADELWRLMKDHDGAPESAVRFQSKGYFSLIRNFRRYCWLLAYLFGASPAIGRDFNGRRSLQLSSLSRDTLCLPYAVSLRMSDMGYQNDAQAELAPDDNQLEGYVRSLVDAMNQPHPPYVHAGVRRNGKWIQVNTNRLQMENEYYSTIRPKRVPQANERPLEALSRRGVQYIEVRCLDIDPFEPLGINSQTCLFLDAFLLFCALAESPLTNLEERRENNENFSLTVREGRRPQLSLQRQGSPVRLKTWAMEVLDQVAEIAELLDAQRSDGAHVKALAAQKLKVHEVEMTPSARVLAAIQKEDGSFPAFALRQSMAHAEHFRARPLSEEESAFLHKQAHESLVEQERAERTQTGDFDDFIKQYQAVTYEVRPKEQELPPPVRRAAENAATPPHNDRALLRATIHPRYLSRLQSPRSALTLPARTSSAEPLRNYQLADNLHAESGRIFLTGIQALVRLPLMQRRLDRERNRNTAGFVAGYRGSPLGGYDRELLRARKILESEDIRFLPAINEELAATAVLGTQQIESDPQRTVDGVFAIWYGKGPGVDRAGDALKHGNVYGSSPRGGVLVVAGDDHGCVSSSMPHQSEFSMQAWGMPIVNPSNITEYLEFGLYGWELSRFSGTWVGFKAISETVESASTVDLDGLRTRFEEATDFVPPAGGLHYRWPDLPSLGIETRHAIKQQAVRAFARKNSIDKLICPSPSAGIGIVTCGKAHLDLMEVLRHLQLSPADLERAGVRVYKVGLSFPLEPTRMAAFIAGLTEVLVIEEKGPIVEQQIKHLFFNVPASERPLVVGKTDALGRELLSAEGELRPSRIAQVVAEWLARHRPACDRRHLLSLFAIPRLPSNASDGVKRVPFFCSGCPHSTSTKVPEGSRALAGIGCHFMASWMDRDTTGLIQMGGEGVDWVSHSMFTTTNHVFQNLGDGTYFHSGLLAIRQAIAGGTNITYKILFNDAVAMTGGQSIDGKLTVDALASQVDAEGAAAIAIVSDAPDKYDGQRHRFPKKSTFHDRSGLDSVQRKLREVRGVTVLIYDQVCAAEKRRRKKHSENPDRVRHQFINPAVCEGCGDCGAQSNCLSIVPLETELGRKRAIDQSSCNSDYSCVKGFCPSFVSVIGGKIRGSARGAIDFDQWRAAAAELTAPQPHDWTGPYNLLVSGVGGTGVVTIGALISMAAHLEGKVASVLDFTGFAQKGGAVLSFVRMAMSPDVLHQPRIDIQQADALLVCDMAVGASVEVLQTIRKGHTRVLVNTHQTPTGASLRDPDASPQESGLMDKMLRAAGAENVMPYNAQQLTKQLFRDTLMSNVLLMGFAWQRGLIPVSLNALERAIELNDVAVDVNKAALAVGRLAASDPGALPSLQGLAAQLPSLALAGSKLEQLVGNRAQLLSKYQNRALAEHYRAFVARAEAKELDVLGANAPLSLASAVARNYAKLLAYKDEYEVARLHTDGEFIQELSRQFEGPFKLQFHLAPPWLAWLAGASSGDQVPKKITFGSWMSIAFRILAKGKFLRGTPFDLFGYTAERGIERQLIRAYAALIEELLPKLNHENLSVMVALAEIPERIRGYGHVKLASIQLAKQREAELLSRLEKGAVPKLLMEKQRQIGIRSVDPVLEH